MILVQNVGNSAMRRSSIATLHHHARRRAVHRHRKVPMTTTSNNNPLTARQLHNNTVWTTRTVTLQLAPLSGASYLPLFFQWLHPRERIRMYGLSATYAEEDATATTQQVFLACSPSVTKKSLLDRLREFLCKYWRRLKRFWLVTWRTTQVALRFSPLLVLSPAAILSHRLFGSTIMSDLAWGYSIKAIQAMGPVAIKFCQWAATRRDIFPPVLCDRLSVLHDRGYPHSFAWTQHVLTEAFGDYEAKGLILQDVIGCGSAAQVYKGKLKTGNATNERDVAIKVLHPNFQASVDRDLLFIEIIAEFLDSLPIEHLKMLNLPRVVDEFSVVLKDQADLKVEAENLRKFRDNFYHKSERMEEESSIIFPAPIEGWTSSQVMLEDYVGDAAPIASFLQDSSIEGMKVRKELAGPLLRAF